MFTSKLPRFNTSAKRPSGPNDGSTSFLASSIPVSVRKANLFTPQPKRSLHGTMSSSKPYMTTEKKYQRLSKPVPDRDEQMRMFSNLVDYLKANAHGFSIPDPKKFFSSVSTTETARIFEVLLSRFQPNLKINKLEIDVPEILAALEYPYIRSVTKSALVSVTTRQAVGNLLVIFNWLVNEVKKFSKTPDEFDRLDPRGDNVFLNVLRGEESAKDQDHHGQLSKKEEELGMIDAEIDDLYEQNREIDELEKCEEKYDHDSEQCEIYFKQMEVYQEDRENKLKEIERASAKLYEEIEDSKKRLDLLETDPYVQAGGQPRAVSVDWMRERLCSLEQEMQNEKSHHDMAMSQVTAQIDKEAQEFKRFVEIIDTKVSHMKQENMSESQELDKLEKADRQNENLSVNFLRETLESNKRAALAIVKKCQEENKFWKSVEQRIADNNKTARTGMKMLCATK